MKFGKQILAASMSSTLLCSEESWMDYKRLKKLIKKVPDDVKEQAHLEERESKQEQIMKESNEERTFFWKLRTELKKVASSFKKMEYEALQRLVSLKSKYQTIMDKEEAEDKCAEFLKNCTETHLHLLMLENYAVLNYAGFVKILKKHDKVTGFSTKDKFLLKLVNTQPFVSHPWLRSAIRNVEGYFRQVRSRVRACSPKEQAVPRQQPQQQLSPHIKLSPTALPAASSSTMSPVRAQTFPYLGLSPVLGNTANGDLLAERTASAAVLLAKEELKRQSESPTQNIVTFSQVPEFHERLLQYHSLLAQNRSNMGWLQNALDRGNIYDPSGMNIAGEGGEQVSDSGKSDEVDDKDNHSVDSKPGAASTTPSPFSFAQTLDRMALLASSSSNAIPYSEYELSAVQQLELMAASSTSTNNNTKVQLPKKRRQQTPSPSSATGGGVAKGKRRKGES